MRESNLSGVMILNRHAGTMKHEGQIGTGNREFGKTLEKFLIFNRLHAAEGRRGQRPTVSFSLKVSTKWSGQT